MNDPLRLDQISLNVVPDALVRMAQDIAAATASIARPVEQLRATLRLWWLFEIAPHAKTSLPHMLAIYHAREAGIEVPRWASERIMDCAAAAARGMTANRPGKKRQTDSDTLAQAFGFSGRRGRGRADDDVRRLQRDLDLAIAVHDRIFPSDGGRGDKFYIACQLVADETKTPVSAVTRAYRRLKEKLRAELQES